MFAPLHFLSGQFSFNQMFQDWISKGRPALQQVQVGIMPGWYNQGLCQRQLEIIVLQLPSATRPRWTPAATVKQVEVCLFCQIFDILNAWGWLPASWSILLISLVWQLPLMIYFHFRVLSPVASLLWPASAALASVAEQYICASFMFPFLSGN